MIVSCVCLEARLGESVGLCLEFETIEKKARCELYRPEIIVDA